MKQADTNTLSDAELTMVQGGYPSDNNSTVPEDPTGKPLLPRPLPKLDTPSIPRKGSESIIPETVPTPPIYPFPIA
jgi:hypothetical protein